MGKSITSDEHKQDFTISHRLEDDTRCAQGREVCASYLRHVARPDPERFVMEMIIIKLMRACAIIYSQLAHARPTVLNYCTFVMSHGIV